MEAGKVAGGGWVLAGRSDLTEVSLSAAENNGCRKLKVTATVPVKLVSLGKDGDTAHVAVVLVAVEDGSHTLPVNAAAAVLHLDDANWPRMVVVGGAEALEPSKKGWGHRDWLMAARAVDNEIIVIARVVPQHWGLKLCAHGGLLFVDPVEQRSGPVRSIKDDNGNPIYRLVSARIGWKWNEAAEVYLGGNNLKIPTDQAPDNVVPDFSRALRVLQPPTP